MLLERLVPLVGGCVLDCIFGDPYRFPHIIRLIGRIISGVESVLYPRCSKSKTTLRIGGIILVVVTLSLSLAIVGTVLFLAHRIHPVCGLVADTFVCYQMVCARQLGIEAIKVQSALEHEGLEAARKAVSMIVGRDTQALDEAGVARAAIETVAENASDGVVAPLLYMALFGPLGGVAYKATNTMDSMVGYKNDRYRYFGTAAAKLDDVLNFIPSRICGLIMCLAAPLVGLSGKGAWHVFLRDRLKHASPNSAQGEAATAGALGVRLAGPASYFGKIHEKEWIGDDTRPVEPQDISRAVRLMYATSLAMLALCMVVTIVVKSLPKAR